MSTSVLAGLPLVARTMALRDFHRVAPGPSGAPSPLATAKLVFSTGAAVPRYDWLRDRAYNEVLVVASGAINMTRLQNGAPILNTHGIYDLSDVLGVVENPSIADGEGLCDATFSRRDDVAGYVQDVADGIIRNVSVGYTREAISMEPPAQDGLPWTYNVTSWTPFEVSLVPIGADAGAQVRSADGKTVDCEGREVRTFPCEFIESRSTSGAKTMSDEKKRQAIDAEIRELAKFARLPDDFASGLITRELTVEVARSEMVNELARRDLEAGGHRNVRPEPQTAEDELVLMAEALTARMGGPALKRENPFRHVRVVDMARECLERAGVRTTAMSANMIVERAGMHTTSDFPNLLMSSGNRVLRNAYESYQGGIKRIAKASKSTDFRAKQMLQLSEAPALLQVNEHAEFKQGSMSEAKESYQIATFGRIFSITRQALVNDDLDAFGDTSMRLGRASAEFEATFLVNLLTSNPTMNDSIALFHASHGNLGTGGGSVLSIDSLSTARAAMRLQKGLDGVTAIDATPVYLVVPAALETAGQQLITQITPFQSSDVNPFAGKLTLVVDPRLDANSATAWYLAADTATIDGLEYSYLDGEEGPQVFMQQGFEVDGVQFKVRLDYGAGVLDWRGLYKSAGA